MFDSKSKELVRRFLYTYDDMGNRISYSKTRNGTVQESAEYSYNASNQLIRAKLYDGKKTPRCSMSMTPTGT